MIGILTWIERGNARIKLACLRLVIVMALGSRTDADRSNFASITRTGVENMNGKQKAETALCILLAVVFLSGPLVIASREDAKEVDREEAARQQHELESLWGRELASGIVRHNCQGDLLGLIKGEKDRWGDAWCARHYSHLLN